MVGRLESVQQWVAKMVRDLGHVTYRDSLREFGLLSLLERRLRGNLIAAYKTWRVVTKIVEPMCSW